MNNREEKILHYVEIAKRYINSKKVNRKEDWLDTAIFWICEKYEKIEQADNPEAYVIGNIKWLNPVFAKERVEVQIPVNKDGESLEDYIFVDEKNAETELLKDTEEEEEAEPIKKRIKETEGIIKNMGFYKYIWGNKGYNTKPKNIVRNSVRVLFICRYYKTAYNFVFAKGVNR